MSQIEGGDPTAAEHLLPQVYNELRQLAAAKLAQEQPGQTLQATALVHEAYLRVTSGAANRSWQGCRHFFAAAAEAMRRILIDQARRKKSGKHGGELERIELDESLLAESGPRTDLLELADLVEQLAAADPQAGELVKLRFFAGLTGDQAAEVLGISPRTADFTWSYARAWLFERLQRTRG